MGLFWSQCPSRTPLRLAFGRIRHRAAVQMVPFRCAEEVLRSRLLCCCKCIFVSPPLALLFFNKPSFVFDAAPLGLLSVLFALPLCVGCDLGRNPLDDFPQPSVFSLCP